MGRNTTTAQSIESACKLDLRIMLKDGSICKNRHLGGSINWEHGGAISFESKVFENEKYLHVMYTTTNRYGSTTKHDYKIQLVSVPSNLGKGQVLYFRCPKTGKRARVLYSTYGNDLFLHRDYYKDHYGQRLFYNSQIASKDWYNNTMYFNYKRQVESFEKYLLTFKQWKRTYRGKETRHFKKLRQLKEKMMHYDIKRCEALRKVVYKYENIP
ncbi:hypothetical protein [Kordia jejudonensis]|uniref:hypothetical protein n=1 Tax=Kordia jejudonensis TaxID=1348245 RepID=UPI000629455B|nr:hypothetical protein [Kordia jejudonensis]